MFSFILSKCFNKVRSNNIKESKAGIKMNELRKMLMKHEGFRGMPYKCTAGKVTIGYGRNLDDVGLSEAEMVFLGVDSIEVAKAIGVSEYEAGVLLDNDIGNAIKGCRVLDVDFETLDNVRKDVLIDMMFNLGFGRLSKFKRTLQYIKERRFDDASVEMLCSKWAKQVHRRANELSKMMETGKYS